MAMTAEQLKTAFQMTPIGTRSMLGRMLREFGYPAATDEAVEKEIRSLLQGNEPCNLSYGLWLKRWLEEGID